MQMKCLCTLSKDWSITVSIQDKEESMVSCKGERHANCSKKDEKEAKRQLFD